MGRLAQVQSYMNGRAAASQAAATPGSAGKAEPGGSGKQQKKRRASMPAPGSFSRPRASQFF